MNTSFNQPKGPVSKESNKQAIARLLGIKKSQVSYLTTAVAIDSFQVLFEPSSQLVFWRGDATGIPSTWTVDNGVCTITTSTGVYSLYAAYAPAQTAPSTSEAISVDDMTVTKGSYDVIPYPDELQAVAAHTFGGSKNTGTVLIDQLCRPIFASSVDGMPAGEPLMGTTAQGTGYFRGPYEDVLVSFNVAGKADPDKTYKLLCSTDEVTKRPRFAMVHPRTYDKEGLITFDPFLYAYGTPFRNQVLEIASLGSIGYGLSKSFDAGFLFNNPGIRYYKVASFNNPTNVGNASLTAKIVIGNWGSYAQRSYNLSVNAQNAKSQTVTKETINQWLQFTCDHGRRDARVESSALTPSMGIVQVKDAQGNPTGVFDVYLKLPTNSRLFSCTVLNNGDDTVISMDWTLATTRYTDLLSTEPTGIVYAKTAWPFTSNDTIMLNNGTLVPFMGSAVLRVGATNIATNRPDFLQTPFVSGSAIHAYTDVSASLAAMTVTQNADNTYTVTGATLTWNSFRSKEPVPFNSQSAGNTFIKPTYYLVFDAVDATAKTFTFSIRTKVTTATVNSTVTPNTVSLSESLSAPIAIPAYTWADFEVRW